MTDRRIGLINTLFFISSAFIWFGCIYLTYREKDPREQKIKYEKHSIFEEIAEEKRSIFNPRLDKALTLRDMCLTIPIAYVTAEYEYIGTYFITAYCPEECGYNGSNYPAGWRTASGEICHYESEWYEPTTCAIDRNFHGFGELILVGDPDDPDNRKIYITEDTGPGVRGRWVDCFVETMDEVDTWPTRFESVYTVTYTTHYMTAKEGRQLHDWLDNYLHGGDVGDWFFGGHDPRVND